MNEHDKAILERMGQGDIWDGYTVDHHWFHIVKEMIFDGRMKEMGSVAWAVYCAIKAHTAFNDGRAWPSQDRIASLIGVSVDTVARATKKLVDMGILIKVRRGNRNEYKIKENIPVKSEEGSVVATASTDYIPMLFKKHMDELKAFVASGDMPKNAKFEITLNMPITVVNQGDGSTMTINNVNVSASNPQSEEAVRYYHQMLNRIQKIG